MPFTTEEFPGRSFEDFDEYDKAKKDRDRILRELNKPKAISVEISIEEQETAEDPQFSSSHEPEGSVREEG